MGKKARETFEKQLELLSERSEAMLSTLSSICKENEVDDGLYSRLRKFLIHLDEKYCDILSGVRVNHSDRISADLTEKY